MEGKEYKQHNRNPESGRIGAGIIILTVGLVLLAGQMNLSHLFPRWILSGPMIIIVVGLVLGVYSNFKNPVSYIMIAFGALFLIQQQFHFNFWKLMFPAGLIGLGLWLMLDKRRSSGQRNSWHHKGQTQAGTGPFGQEYTQWDANVDHEATSGTGNAVSDDEEYLSSTAIFGEEKKMVSSKNLKGGEITNIFGGADINLMQADIQEPITINIFQLFAGTKIIVPAHWRVQSNVVSVFAEVDDRRFMQNTSGHEQKIVYLKGTSIFGGITIKSM